MWERFKWAPQTLFHLHRKASKNIKSMPQRPSQLDNSPSKTYKTQHLQTKDRLRKFLSCNAVYDLGKENMTQGQNQELQRIIPREHSWAPFIN